MSQLGVFFSLFFPIFSLFFPSTRLLCVWGASSYLFAASLEEMYPPGICVTM